jgi:hypothetical protein
MTFERFAWVTKRSSAPTAQNQYSAVGHYRPPRDTCGHLRSFFPYNVHMSRYDRPSHRVYMTFFYRAGWQVQFCEADLETPLPRTFTFTGPEKIRELARPRGEARGESESRQMLEHAIENGRGGCYLRLTPEQYRKLRVVSK